MVKKILIVDDDHLTVRLLTGLLKDSGHQVIVAADGETALEQTIREKPDMVIMDIMLPDMQGSDVVKAFQENPDIGNIPVVFLSGLISQTDETDQKIYVGGKSYPAIAKPIDFNQLLSCLRSS